MIKFEFIDPTAQNYHLLLKRCPKSTLLQSYPYAYAIRQTQKLQTRLAILKKGQQEIGFFNIHEAKTLFGLLHVITIDRGPCWFESQDTKENMQDFAAALHQYAPKRFGRMRRFMPETTLSINLANWKYRSKVPHYKTIWLDLTQTITALRNQLNRKWRNHLNQAEKKNLTVDDTITEETIPWFLQGYLKDRMEKHYAGAGLRFSAHLFTKAHEQGDLVLLKALQKSKPIAAIALIKHGQCATYQIGWTTTAGRATNAHHFLLWQAIQRLKNQGICYLDLGGINPETAIGVTQFKRNMGADETTLIGQFG